MKVLIKEFAVDMEVKSKGIEFEVKSPDGASHLGDCYVTKNFNHLVQRQDAQGQRSQDQLGRPDGCSCLRRYEARCGRGCP